MATDSAPQPSLESHATEPSIAADAHALFEAVAGAPLRRPSATYRLQLHQGFGFRDVAATVEYLHDLGISDVYLSPYLAAREGSTHGYDVIDHGRINPEVGDESSHDELIARLKALSMGRVLDIVPNHMGFAIANPFLLDVLENGPQARWSIFFDIDWRPVKGSLVGKLLVPILGDVYGAVLESGQLVLERNGGSLGIRYGAITLPLRPASYATVLGRRPGEFAERFQKGAPTQDTREYVSIRDAAERLRAAGPPEAAERSRRENEAIKGRLARLCEASASLRDFLDETIASYRGAEDDPHSFDALHELLEEQVYRLAYWRVASEEINYRRFFDVTELLGIRVEDPQVFEQVHRLILRWVGEGGVTGLRVDHPDGLADPLGYFQSLQERLFLEACRARWREQGGEDAAWPALSDHLVPLYQESVADDAKSALARRFPVVVEKILSTNEKLPEGWPVDGTVGYEYLNALNGLFVAPESSTAIDAIYREFTGDPDSFAEALHSSKTVVERWLLASELNTLTQLLSRVAESGRRTRDFTLFDLRRVLGEVIACFRVYRTYLRPGQEVSSEDRSIIETTVARARRRLPTVDRLVFDFVRDVLTLNTSADLPEASRRLWDAFVIRFQQTTGPVQAKGLEDTTFYRQAPLLSLNEVGGDPSRWATSPSTFHALNVQRLNDWPGGLSTTATHDTKRGEDVRIRIDVISELTDEWKTRLARWSRWNARKKTLVNEVECPDAREEYMLYQTLLGAWPFGEDAPSHEFVERVQAYVVKAASEAKRNTYWTDPDPSYKEALSKYVTDILESPDAPPFLDDFRAFQRRVARIGVIHSLAQTVLKIASPGCADVYQGTECWDLSMVDPDNRRPVDFAYRGRMLGEIASRLGGGESRADLARTLLHSPEDGEIKLYVVSTLLNYRRSDPDLFMRGSYRSVDSQGQHRDNLVVFHRGLAGRQILVAVPRLVAGLMGEDAKQWPVGRDIWADASLVLPELAPGRWRNILTDEVVDVVETTGSRHLPVGELFATLPLAFLTATGTSE